MTGMDGRTAPVLRPGIRTTEVRGERRYENRNTTRQHNTNCFTKSPWELERVNVRALMLVKCNRDNQFGLP